MGCGHSKINIYKKYKNKANSKNLVIRQEVISKEESETKTETENFQNLDYSDQKRAVKIKHFSSSLLAQTEISTSQQEFFKMLDEKIQNGPDYNSDSESEQIAEAARLKMLLRDWETASLGSRSLPATPKRRLDSFKSRTETLADVDNSVVPTVNDIYYKSQVTQSVSHQAYGLPPVAYLQTQYNNSNYLSKSPSYQHSYQPPLQYHPLNAMCNSNDAHFQPPPHQLRQYPSYNQYGSPIKTYVSSPTKHAPHDSSSVTYSPTHRLYGPLITVPCNKDKHDTNLEYNNTYYIQSNVHGHQEPPQMFNHPKQYQPYKEVGEKVLVQHQQQNSYRGPPKSYHQPNVSTSLMRDRPDMNSLHQNYYELT